MAAAYRFCSPGWSRSHGWSPLTRLGLKVVYQPTEHPRARGAEQVSDRGPEPSERDLASAFEGFALEPGKEHSFLVGEIRDQAHLYGILDRVRDLGPELLSVEKDRGDCLVGEETAR
jgi:hypothetical protein